MRKIIFIGMFIFLGLEFKIIAQEQFAISQYYQIQPILNPGFTGIDDFLDVKIGFRRKWAGIDNSPSTSFVSAFGSIGNKTSYNQSPIRISNPDQINFIKSEKAKIRYHGIGGYISKQEQGAFSQTDLIANYAYHIPIKSKIRISMGTSFGLRSIKVDINKINVWDKGNDQLYQAYVNGGGNYLRFLVSLGGVVYGDKSYVGISYSPVIDAPISNENENLSTADKLRLMAGTRIVVGTNMSILPSIMIDGNIVSKSKFVGSIVLDIKSIVKTGIAYSSTNDVSFSVMVNYKNDFGISYALETSLGNETIIGNGTHEIILSFNLFNHLNSSPQLW